MNAVQLFNFRGDNVRVIDRDGEPWFVLADVCKVLGLTNPTTAAEAIDSDGLSTAEVIDSMGRTQLARIVNEAGLYELIFKSRKPEARPFKRWVTREVLPSIRKTGAYGRVSVQVLPDEEIVSRALQITTRQVEALKERNAVLEPKADAYDAFIEADGTYLIGNVAKMLGWGQNTMFRELREAGVLIGSGPYYNTPYQQYAHHFKVVARNYPGGNSYTTYVRPSGIDFIRRKLGIGAYEMETTA